MKVKWFYFALTSHGTWWGRGTVTSQIQQHWFVPKPLDLSVWKSVQEMSIFPQGLMIEHKMKNHSLLQWDLKQFDYLTIINIIPTTYCAVVYGNQPSCLWRQTFLSSRFIYSGWLPANIIHYSTFQVTWKRRDIHYFSTLYFSSCCEQYTVMNNKKS